MNNHLKTTIFPDAGDKLRHTHKLCRNWMKRHTFKNRLKTANDVDAGEGYAVCTDVFVIG